MSDDDADFDKCLDFVLLQEGGYNIAPFDPGGPTNMGITLDTLSAWRGTAVSREALDKLTRLEAAEIYKEKFWRPCRCSALPLGLSLAVFDAAVNSGVKHSVKFLQLALGVPEDGICGDRTISAARGADAPKAIRDIIAARLEFLKCLPTWPVFGAGWTQRCVRLEKEALRTAVSEA